jgi:3-hydroxyisobutyrate dehydrogenase
MTSTDNRPEGDQTGSSTGLTVAVVGLGEVGRAYSTALHAAGHDVHGHDPYATGPIEGVKVFETLAEAVSTADVILTLTVAAASRTVAEGVAEHLKQGAIYVDFTSSGPEAKRGLAEVFAARPDVELVDVAILGPVIQLGAATPLMAAGPAADKVARLMEPLGSDVTVVEGGLGDAMAHKLLRSVFMKGLAAAITEAVTAGRAAGFEDWIREQIARELAGDGHNTMNRLIRGSVVHAQRRSEEMVAATEYLTDLGVDATMAAATAEHLQKLKQDR